MGKSNICTQCGNDIGKGDFHPDNIAHQKENEK